ncbi:hypothetical protein [Sebaldella termitidis]|uniref:hypothetical protein n=1 Tax=Sebaldella termitidis TaxID=826 RepID=UPI003EBFFFD5
MSDKIQGLKMEVSFIVKDKNILRYLESIKKASSSAFTSVEKDIKKNDKMLNNFSIKLKNLDFFRLQSSFNTISAYFKALEKDIDRIIDKNKTMQINPQKNLEKQANVENPSNNQKTIKQLEDFRMRKEKITLLDQYSSSISNISLAIDSLGSDKLTKFFAPLKKGNSIIVNLKKINIELKKITQINGKFNFFKTFKFGAFAVGLALVTYLMGKFTNYLKNNEDIQKSWQKVIESTKRLLSTVGKAILDLAFAILGIDADGFEDGIVKGLDKISANIDKVTEKFEEFRKWINDHKEEFKQFGEIVKEWGPAILALAAAAAVASGPLGVVVVAVGIAFKLESDRKKFNKDFEEFLQKNPNKNGLDFIRDRDNKKKIERLDKNPDDWRYKKPHKIIKKWWNSVISGDFSESIEERDHYSIWNKIKEKINLTLALAKIASAVFRVIATKILSLFDSIQIDFDSFVEWMKGRILETADFLTKLTDGVIPFHEILIKIKNLFQEIVNFSGTVIEIFINYIKNGVMQETSTQMFNSATSAFEKINDSLNNQFNNSKSNKVKQTATGTNYFPGGFTTINEQGDELILGPSGMIVANNPSTMNIMRSLATMDGNISQIKFGINGDSGRVKANNITINIGNISNRSDIDYLARQISMLDLS